MLLERRFDTEIIDRTKAYIIENLEKNESVEHIAKKVFFSAHYLRHLFKKRAGVTIQEFKNRERLKKAKLLLLSGENKIVEIAAACGYESPAYFSEVFVKEMGMNPTDFRKTMRGEM